jgi:hypothetical protein
MVKWSSPLNHMTAKTRPCSLLAMSPHTGVASPVVPPNAVQKPERNSSTVLAVAMSDAPPDNRIDPAMPAAITRIGALVRPTVLSGFALRQ